MQINLTLSAKRSMATALRYGVLSIICLLVTAVSLAQAPQQFTGRVADASGAVVPGAQVDVLNQATGVDKKTVTTAQGAYAVPYLLPGTYTITVTMAGFKTEKQTDITLNVDQTSTIDFHLAIGTPTETVTVTADASQIELSKADRGEIIDGQRVSEMPLDGRNPLNLFNLSPGTHDFSQEIYPRPFDLNSHNLYANGSPQVGSYNIDGLSNDAGGTSGAVGLVPSVDALGEYKVVLNAYDASYGHSGGSAIDLSFKSGANQFHGVLDYFMRRTWLDAYGWQVKYQNPTHPQKASHKRDQYSFEFDGPIRIPHLFNGKDKLFYLVNYEFLHDVLPSASYSTFSLPNPAWATGNFGPTAPGGGLQFEYQYPGGNFPNPCGTGVPQCLLPVTIYDPLTPLHPVVDPLDGVTKMAHDPFPNNIIPANRIDPVGAAMLATYAYVKPNNNPGVGFAPWTNNYVNLQVEDDIWRNALVKIDYNPREADRLSFRWGAQGRWNNVNSNTGFPTNDPANMHGNQIQPHSQTGSAQWTHTVSPKLLFNLGVSLISENENGSSYGSTFANESATLGFGQNYYNQLTNNQHFPYINISGLPSAQQYAYLGSNTGLGSSSVLHSLQFLPTVTFVHGVHTMRAGIDMRFQQFDNPTGGSLDNYNFTNNFTKEFYNFNDATNYTSGSAIASLLLGYPNSGTVYANAHYFYSQHYYAPWFQDDWKLTRKLTVNLGMRWDFLTPRVERHNKVTGVFNPAVVNPVSAGIPAGSIALGSSTTLQGGLTYAGVNGQPRSAFAMNKLDVQPRVGFAYAITDRMSIRGGIGQNYLNDTSNNGNSGFSSSTPYTNSLDNGLTPYTATTGVGLSAPIATVIQPTGSSLGYLQNLGTSLSFYNPQYHLPSFWSYSLTYEVGITKHDVVSVSYVGNREPNGPTSDDINHISPQWNAQCDVERGGNRQLCDNSSTNPAVGGQVANPFLGIAAFKGQSYYNSPTISRSNFTRPYPEFTSITENGITNTSKNWYNSFQATAAHNFSGLSLHLAYTHAKAETAGGWLDTVNRIVARQVSTTNDVNHSISFSGVGYLPFGRGRLLFSKANRLVDEAINGWEISPLYTYYSGFAWRPGNGNWEEASTGTAVDGKMGVDHTTLGPDGQHGYSRIRGASPCVGAKNTDTGAIVPSASAAGCASVRYVTAPNSYALSRVNIDYGVRQPGAYTFNMAASKNFKIPGGSRMYLSEATNLQLRVDILNVFNHATWDEGYNNNSSSLDFGTIAKGPSGPTNTPRYLQLSGKFSW